MRLTREPDAFLQRHAFVLSDDRQRLDLDCVLDELATHYWAKEEPRGRLRKSLEAVHAYGFFAPDGSPAGFLSILSDGVYNARLTNFFIIPEHQGCGLGRWILSTLLFESRFCDVRNWRLATDDGQTLYQRFGFRIAERTDTFMTLRK